MTPLSSTTTSDDTSNVDDEGTLSRVLRNERQCSADALGAPRERLPPPREEPPEASPLGLTLLNSVPQAEPGVLDRRRVQRRRRPEDPPQMGLGVHRRHQGADVRNGEYVFLKKYSQRDAPG